MQRDELLALLTPEAMTLLDDAPAVESSADALALVTKLRAAGGSPAVVAAVVTQSKLRRRAVAKFGPFAERMLFTDAGLQQATRLQVAAHHANRFRQAGAVSVADLGCGIGADAMAFASLGLEVTAYDLDEVTAAIAAHNLAPFPNAQVKHGRAEEVDLGSFDALWFDPARRTTSGEARHGISIRPTGVPRSTSSSRRDASDRPESSSALASITRISLTTRKPSGSRPAAISSRRQCGCTEQRGRASAGLRS